MKRREVLEQHLVARALGRVKVDLADLHQCEIALAIFGRTDQTRQRIAGAQVKAAHLLRADVDVIGASQVRRIGRTQEAEAVLQYFEHAFAVDVLAVARMRLQDREDDVLLARAGQALESHGLGHLDQFVYGLGFELVEAHGLARLRQIGRADDLAIAGRIERLGVIDLFRPAAEIAVYIAVAVIAAGTGAVAALTLAATTTTAALARAVTTRVT